MASPSAGAAGKPPARAPQGASQAAQSATQTQLPPEAELASPAGTQAPTEGVYAPAVTPDPLAQSVDKIVTALLFAGARAAMGLNASAGQVAREVKEMRKQFDQMTEAQK